MSANVYICTAFSATETQNTKIFTKPYFSSTFLLHRSSKIWRSLDQDYDCTGFALQPTEK